MKVELLDVVGRRGSSWVSAGGRSPGQRGFTLIELLVVMAIIAILAAAVIPVSSMIMAKLRDLQATHAAADIRKSISTYSTDYRRYPLAQDGKIDTDVETDTGSTLMGVLLASDKETQADGLNPRNRVFFTGRKVSNTAEPRNGIKYESGGGGELFDPWGNLYRVIIDTNRDERCKDPSRPGETVAQDVLVWSLGPNGEDERGKGDDITTWGG